MWPAFEGIPAEQFTHPWVKRPLQSVVVLAVVLIAPSLIAWLLHTDQGTAALLLMAGFGVYLAGWVVYRFYIRRS